MFSEDSNRLPPTRLSQINQIRRSRDDSINILNQALQNFQIIDNDKHFEFDYIPPPSPLTPPPPPRQPIKTKPKILKVKQLYDNASNVKKRAIEKNSFQLFMQFIFPGIEYDPQQITNVYNFVFNSNISHKGFGRLLEVKKYFNVIKRRGKKGTETFYVRK